MPNKFGGRENIAAIEFFKTLSTAVKRESPGRAAYCGGKHRV